MAETQKPRDSWRDHPPEDFSWQRVFAIIGVITTALVGAFAVVWVLFRP
jgi:hypothetical protein